MVIIAQEIKVSTLPERRWLSLERKNEKTVLESEEVSFVVSRRDTTKKKKLLLNTHMI